MLKKSHVFPHPSLCHVWRTTWQKQCKHVYFSSSTPPQFCWSLCPHTAHNENGLCGLLWLLNNKTPSCIFPLMAMVSFWNLWKTSNKMFKSSSFPSSKGGASSTLPFSQTLSNNRYLCSQSFLFSSLSKAICFLKRITQMFAKSNLGLHWVASNTEELIEAFQMLKSNLNSQPWVQNHRGSIRLCFELFSN